MRIYSTALFGVALSHDASLQKCDDRALQEMDSFQYMLLFRLQDQIHRFSDHS